MKHEWFIRLVQNDSRIAIKQFEATNDEAIAELEKYQKMNPTKRFELSNKSTSK